MLSRNAKVRLPKHIVIRKSSNILSTTVDVDATFQESFVSIQQKFRDIKTVSTQAIKQSVEEEKAMKQSIVTGGTLWRHPWNTKNTGKAFWRCWNDFIICAVVIL